MPLCAPGHGRGGVTAFLPGVGPACQTTTMQVLPVRHARLRLRLSVQMPESTTQVQAQMPEWTTMRVQAQVQQSLQMQVQAAGLPSALKLTLLALRLVLLLPLTARRLTPPLTLIRMLARTQTSMLG